MNSTDRVTSGDLTFLQQWHYWWFGQAMLLSANCCEYCSAVSSQSMRTVCKSLRPSKPVLQSPRVDPTCQLARQLAPYLQLQLQQRHAH